jgi:hypothetical protein
MPLHKTTWCDGEYHYDQWSGRRVEECDCEKEDDNDEVFRTEETN